MTGKHKSKSTGETNEHQAIRLAREHRERLERENYGLPLEQLHAAHALLGDSLDLMHTVAQRGELRIGKPGSEIAKLVDQGFIEISAANGHDSIAKVTAAGLAALVLRLSYRSASPKPLSRLLPARSR